MRSIQAIAKRYREGLDRTSLKIMLEKINLSCIFIPQDSKTAHQTHCSIGKNTRTDNGSLTVYSVIELMVCFIRE